MLNSEPLCKAISERLSYFYHHFYLEILKLPCSYQRYTYIKIHIMHINMYKMLILSDGNVAVTGLCKEIIMWCKFFSTHPNWLGYQRKIQLFTNWLIISVRGRVEISIRCCCQLIFNAYLNSATTKLIFWSLGGVQCRSCSLVLLRSWGTFTCSLNRISDHAHFYYGSSSWNIYFCIWYR